MTDRFFLATLTLSMLVVGSMSIVSALVDGVRREPAPVVQLETVVITAKRLAPSADVVASEHVEPAAPRAQ